MWTCPEGYTRGPPWVGRVLGRLILQKGRQSSGVVIPNKKGSDNNTSAAGRTHRNVRASVSFGSVVKISGSILRSGGERSDPPECNLE